LHCGQVGMSVGWAFRVAERVADRGREKGRRGWKGEILGCCFCPARVQVGACNEVPLGFRQHEGAGRVREKATCGGREGGMDGWRGRGKARGHSEGNKQEQRLQGLRA
jgi:hypothetical protein